MQCNEDDYRERRWGLGMGEASTPHLEVLQAEFYQKGKLVEEMEKKSSRQLLRHVQVTGSDVV